MFETIVWATDGSEIASEALPALTELALRHGATVVAVHVDQRFRGSRCGAAPSLADEEDILKTISEQVADLNQAGIDARLQIESTDWLTTATLVAEVALEMDADLIVVGTHGRGAIGSAVLGSVAKGLLQEAHCPVLVVPAVLETVKSVEPELILVG